MAEYKAWDAPLWGYEPYSSDELSILVNLILELYNEKQSEYPYKLYEGQEYILKMEDFDFIIDAHGKVRVEFWQSDLTYKADSDPFKSDTSNAIFRGLMTEFNKIPLLMHRANTVTQMMIRWRLQIGR
jgi:hypothetical protein